MKKLLTLAALALALQVQAQTNPAITSWIQNTTGITGRHYVSGNPTPISDTARANVKWVVYSSDYAYIKTSGIPAYVIGPYQDGNPSQAVGRNYLFKIPLNPRANTSTLTSVGLGQTGVLINGVPIYNYADARSYNNGGIWHQNAIVFEKAGFDCAKGHPSPIQTGPPGGPPSTRGSYHHHQNPSAFDAARVSLSNVCDVYLADGLYVPDSSQHGPLIGFAFDGFPIYGAYGYANANGTGGIKRMTPSYRMRNITARTSLTTGPLTSSQYGPTLAAQALGSYSEDYEYVAGSGDLDEHNGRFCVTPEYPQGIYCYFAIVDADGNSVYPYIIGSTYYGVVETANLPVQGSQNPTNVTVTGPVTTYTAPVTAAAPKASLKLTAYPNPAQDVLVVQVAQPNRQAQLVELLDLTGRTVRTQVLHPGSTMVYFDTQALYAGTYLLRVEGSTQRVVIGN